ncbi:MAG: hypothetical protein Fur0043_14800 [Anaerolineales bacterium]
MKKFLLSQWRLEREAWLALLAFGVNVFLVFNAFLPSLRDLNFWDEAVYINTGRLLRFYTRACGRHREGGEGRVI